MGVFYGEKSRKLSNSTATPLYQTEILNVAAENNSPLYPV
jgi:hypothetical protein